MAQQLDQLTEEQRQERVKLHKAIYAHAKKLFPQLELEEKTSGGKTRYASVLHWRTLDNNGHKDPDADRTILYKDVTTERSYMALCFVDNGGDGNIDAVRLYAYYKDKKEPKDVDSKLWGQYLREMLTIIERADLIKGRAGAMDDFKDLDLDAELAPSYDKEADLFTAALLKGDTKEAKAVLEYLRQRGWTKERIKEAKLGLITRKAINQLDDKELAGAFNHPNIGKYNLLAIPYIYDHHVRNFTTRRIDTVKDKKYLNTGTIKLTALAHITNQHKAITIVEGWLDAAPAQAIGLTDIVCSGTNKGNDVQIPDAIKRGVEEFTLLLDNDAAGQKGTKSNIATLLKADKKIYIATYPEAHNQKEPLKDLGDFILDRTRDHVIKGAKPEEPEAGKAYTDDPNFNKELNELLKADYYSEIHNRRKPYSLYRLEEILIDGAIDRYNDLGAEYSPATPIDEVKEFLAQHASQQTVLCQRTTHEIINHLATLDPVETPTALYILDEWQKAYMFVASALINTANKAVDARRKKAIHDGLKDAASKAAIGDTATAIAIAQDVITQNPDTSAAQHAQIVINRFRGKTEAKVYNDLGQVARGINTQWLFSDGTEDGTEYLTLNAGITFVVANTGHGKTTFLNNLALYRAARNIAIWKRKGCKGKLPKIAYFSYEVSYRKLTTDLLNTYVNDPQLSRRKPLQTIRTYLRSADNEHEFNDNKLDNGKTHFENFKDKKLVFWRDYLDTGAILVDDEAHTVETLLDVIKALKEREEIDLVLIDYAQLLGSAVRNNQARPEEIKDIVKMIKDYAESVQLPIVMAAQFNRQVNSLADLALNKIGEGGDFERVADTVIVLYNLAYIDARESGDEGKKKPDILRALKRAGITPPKKGETSRPTTEVLIKYYNIMYAKILKRRDGENDLEGVLAWTGKTKYIAGNADLSIYDPEYMAALYDKEEEAIKAGAAFANKSVEAITKAVEDSARDETGVQVYRDNIKEPARYSDTLAKANSWETQAAISAHHEWLKAKERLGENPAPAAISAHHEWQKAKERPGEIPTPPASSSLTRQQLLQQKIDDAIELTDEEFIAKYGERPDKYERL